MSFSFSSMPISAFTLTAGEQVIFNWKITKFLTRREIAEDLKNKTLAKLAYSPARIVSTFYKLRFYFVFHSNSINQVSLSFNNVTFQCDNYLFDICLIRERDSLSELQMSRLLGIWCWRRKRSTKRPVRPLDYFWSVEKTSSTTQLRTRGSIFTPRTLSTSSSTTNQPPVAQVNFRS